MEKTTKRGVKKLLLSVMVMVIALVAAGTSTFAWFTTSANPQVGRFETKVTAVDGLYIALDTTNAVGGIGAAYQTLDYKAYIPGADLQTFLGSVETAVNAKDENYLVGATSADGTTFADILGFASQQTAVKNGGIPYGRPVTTKERSYFEFTLYFRSVAETQIGLDFYNYAPAGTDIRTYVDPGVDGGITAVIPAKWNNINAAPANWTVDAGGNVTSVDLTAYGGTGTAVPGDIVTANGSNAYRLSFTGKDDLALAATNTAIWNPNADKGFITGNLALDLYNAQYETTYYTEPAYVTSGANYYETTAIGSEVLMTTSTDRTSGAGSDGFWYGSLTIRLWLEGFDGDCLNGTMGDAVMSALQFAIIP